jgi:hypothetical protein
MWAHEESIETTAAPGQIWKLFSDVTGWKKWNAGIVEIELHGPFASGTKFTMQIPKGEKITSTLMDVKEYVSFSDKMTINGTNIVVEHNIIPWNSGHNLIRYRAVANGPEAEELGPRVISDFRTVLIALKDLAESQTL